jgi:competence protein ComFB
MRRKYGPLIGQTNLVPLVLSPFMLFVPIKVRTPRVSGDPTYGYFRIRSVMGVAQMPEPCSLVLEGDHRLTVKQSIRTVRARLRACVNLEKILIDECCRTMDLKQQLFLAETFLSGNFLQENGGAYGIKREEDEKGVCAMELRNLMEALVMQRLDEVLTEENNEVCQCEQCRLDMAAIALNDLPPRYVVTQRGETYSKADLLEVQRFVDVLTALAKAVKIVKNNPRH